MKKLLVILGPTSTGKTDVALELAKKFNGELVSCDSRQVYKDLDIGTGKMPSLESSARSQAPRVIRGDKYWEIDGIKIWMYDVVDFKKQYTVFHYISDAKKVIDDIESRGKLPIIVGGTGLYLKAFLEGMSNLYVPIDKNLRQILEKLTVKELQDKLKNLSSLKWESLNNSDKHNSRRLIRAIELVAMGSSSNMEKTSQGLVKNHEILKIGLNSSKEKLYARVDQRVVSRIKLGMIEEAEILHEKGLTVKRMRQLGLEYGLLADYLEKKITIEGLIAKMQSKIHQFVKRQQTWYKKDTQIEWFEISNNDYLKKLEKRVYRWYHDLR